jgi:hypothetical protein
VGGGVSREITDFRHAKSQNSKNLKNFLIWVLCATDRQIPLFKVVTGSSFGRSRVSLPSRRLSG